MKNIFWKAYRSKLEGYLGYRGRRGSKKGSKIEAPPPREIEAKMEARL